MQWRERLTGFPVRGGHKKTPLVGSISRFRGEHAVALALEFWLEAPPVRWSEQDPAAGTRVPRATFRGGERGRFERH